MTEEQHPYNPLDHEPLPEGEEEVPPYVHTMAIVRWVILGGMTLFAFIMLLTYFGLTPWANAEGGDVQYHCPMHPTYIASQPGDCPICGMSLVPIDKSGKAIQSDNDSGKMHEGHAMASAQPGQYTCPMHPEVISDEPGKCSKCGMNLEEVPAKSAAKPGQYYCPMCPEVVSDTMGRCPECGMYLELMPPADSSATTYTCPMHPEVVSDKPGECPKCGMDLVPRESPEESGKMTDHEGQGGDLGSAPVPGLVPVTLESQRLQLIGVRTGTVQKRLLNNVKKLVGYVTPDETRISNLNVRFNGWVQKLMVNQTGQQVGEGEPLLTVYSQDLFQAQQDFLIASESASRSSTDPLLVGTRRQILDAAHERLSLLGMSDIEIGNLENSKQARAELPLTSPFTGVVLGKAVLPGQFVTPAQTLFTIADLSQVWVLADVYESDLSGIKVGQKASLSLTAFPNDRFQGRVTFIYPTVSEQTRTLKVRLEFANPDMQIRPGMYAEVELAGSGASVLTIPRDALMDGGENTYAFVVHDGTHFEPRLLAIGRRTDDFVEVLSGLSDGETVVTSANFLIDSESRLQAAISGMGSTAPDAHAGHGK